MWMIYALGGGWGHLNRSVALARVASRHTPVHLLTNSPYAPQVLATLQHWQHLGIPVPTLLPLSPRVDRASSAAQVRALVQAHPYRCMIVDTFPRGLGGELVDLLPTLPNCHRVWVHRDVKPTYIAAKQVETWVQQHYDQIIVPGEGAVALAHLPQVIHTDPWLLYSAHELSLGGYPLPLPMSPPLAGSGIDPPSPHILLCASGNPPELALYGELATAIRQVYPQAGLRCLAPSCPPGCPLECWVQAWPGMPWLAAADVVIGGGGYNTVYECAALQKPLLGLAWPRLYDRQARRLSRYGLRCTPDTVMTRLAVVLESLPPRSTSILAYGNGALAAVEQILPWV